MRTHLVTAGSIAVIMALLLAACSPAAAPATVAPQPQVPTTAPTTGQPDLTGKTIKFYGMADLSGPSAPTATAVVRGAKDLVAYINDHGGIFGAKIEWIFEDTALKVDQALSIYDRYKSQDKNIVILFVFGTPEQQALKDRVKEDKIPLMGAGPDFTALYGVKDGWEFASAPLYDEQFAYFLDYVVANWSKIKPAGAGDKIKLALLSWNTALGQAPLTEASKAYMAKLGVELVSKELYEASPKADTTTAILNAQAAGANVIYNNTIGYGLANLLNDLRKLGVRDQFVVGTGMLGMDLSTYAFLADPANANGVYGATPYGWYSDVDNPGIKLITDIANQNNRDAKQRGFGRLIASAQVDIAKYAIEQAILKVGYDNLTGQAVYDALTQIKDYKPLGGLTAVDYTNGVRSGRQAQLRQIQGGPDKFVIVKDFSVLPDFRPTQ